MKTFVATVLLLSALAAPACAGQSMTLTHGKAPNPTYIDLGAPGESIGDERIRQFEARSDDGEAVVMNWVMLTMGDVAGSPGIERRMTSAVFTFSSSPSDTILVQGLGLYPSTGATVKIDATLERAVIGGTGKFAGASGTLVTTHLDDGSWQHVMHLQ